MLGVYRQYYGCADTCRGRGSGASAVPRASPLGELTRGDCHRAWALHEVPDHGDSVDARDNDDDASDNARRN